MACNCLPGLTDEECDRLEKDDNSKEEEEGRRRNILKDLHDNYEAVHIPD